MALFPSFPNLDKRLRLTLPNGRDIVILGGRDMRPPPKGAVAFTHTEAEAIFAVNELTFADFEQILILKEKGFNVISVEPPNKIKFDKPRYAE